MQCKQQLADERLELLRERPQALVTYLESLAQTREMDHFKSLGASGVIAKPFDPLTLATSVRRQLHTAGIAALRESFLKRLRADAMALATLRRECADETPPDAALDHVRSFAHQLAGSAGIFGFQQIGAAAAELETLLDGEPPSTPETVEHTLDTLLAYIDDEWQRALVPVGNA